MHSIKIFLVVFLLTLTSISASASNEQALPRFASVKSSEANIRNGPGLRYPVKFVLVRKDIPVEVIAEFENWRKIKEMEGEEGWVHRSMLSGERTVIITNGKQALHEEPEANASPNAYAEEGVTAALVRCEDEWCEVKIANEKGWIHHRNLWGVYPDEKF